MAVEVAKLPSGPLRRTEASELYILRSREARREDLLELPGFSSKVKEEL
jgi:hypothetical protein